MDERLFPQQLSGPPNTIYPPAATRCRRDEGEDVSTVSPVLLSAPEAAKYLGISTRKIYDLVKPRGPIPCYKLGKRLTRFSINDLNEYINSCRFDTYETESVIASNSKPRLTVSGSELLSFFRQHGVKPKLTPSTEKNPPGSTQKEPASNVRPLRSIKR